MSDRFNWYYFSYLMQHSVQFGVRQCSWDLHGDYVTINVLDRDASLVAQEDLGTVYAKEIQLEWRAPDIDHDYSPKKNQPPRRDHKLLLCKSFHCWNMKAKYHSDRWTVLVSVPRILTQPEHEVEFGDRGCTVVYKCCV